MPEYGVGSAASEIGVVTEQIAKKPVEDPSSDLGFGRVVSEQRALRLLNRDGSFNVQRRGRGLNAFLAYSNLVSTSWYRFFVFVAAVYLTLNGCFAVFYVACGDAGLVSTIDIGLHSFFSEGVLLQYSYLGDHRIRECRARRTGDQCSCRARVCC